MGEEKKDYLSSLMDDDSDTLESFKAEKVEHIEKPHRKIRKIWFVIVPLIVILLSGISYFLFFAPKIDMPNFIGKNVSEVTAWISQYEIEKSKVAMSEEFSMEYDKDVVISQSVDEGKKIKTSTPLNFVISKGADPDELIEVPDLESMNESEIKAWISENKLSKTKVNQQYSSSIEQGKVISIVYGNNADASSFTRGTSLTINVSRGPEPAGTVSVTDFVGKTYAEVESWAKEKKIELEKVEAFSDSIVSGNVISQSVASGELLKTGEVLKVTVSKGKGVTIPNLVGYDKVMLEAWQAEATKAGVTIIPKERYSEYPEGSVVEQDQKAGTQLGSGDVLILTISKYLPILNSESSRQWLGKDYVSMQRWADEINSNGGDIQVGIWGNDAYTCSDEFPTEGQIVSYTCMAIDGTELANGCDRPLPLQARIGVKVSTGACTVEPSATPTPSTKVVATFNNFGNNINNFLSWARANGLQINTQEDENVKDDQIYQGNIYDNNWKPIEIKDDKYSFDKNITYTVKIKPSTVIEENISTSDPSGND